MSNLLQFDVAVVGEISRTLFPEHKLDLFSIDIKTIGSLISPACTIAALVMIESVLCGASASRMKGEKFNADRELVAQGVGNMIVPSKKSIDFQSLQNVSRNRIKVYNLCIFDKIYRVIVQMHLV